jgi:hypothetical protein
MTSSSVATLNAPAATAGRLSPAAAFLLLASLTVSFLAGSSAPTPLYGVYMAEWGLTPLMITVIFGIYALAVLLALLEGSPIIWAADPCYSRQRSLRRRRWCCL